MKKPKRFLALSGLILCLSAPISFATPMTLDEALNSTPASNGYNTTTQSVPQTPPEGIPQVPTEQTPTTQPQPTTQTVPNQTSAPLWKASDNALIKDLQNASNMSQYDDGTVKQYAAPIQRILGKLVLILSYVTVAFQIFFFSVDLLYLVAPPTRKFLANGHIGNPQAGNQTGMGGVGGGMGDYGMGGMGGGLYGGRFSHYGGGMGGYGMGGMGMGMNNPYAGNPGMTDMGSRRNSIQWVSNAAISAASAETALTQDGSVNNKFKMYFSQMLVDGVVLGILITFNVTGVTQALGFFLGGVVTNGISNFMK